MATITPIHSRNLADDNRCVRNPLDRLRGYIRSYVGLEGLAKLVLFCALWFWLGYVLDYGFFKVLGIDWVQVLPFWVRAAVLAVLAGLILTVVSLQMVGRLFREFSDSALALVLERRFPQLLGDRLITAVELSDPDKAAQYGYSRAMVRETIAEAADAVGKLPLKQVFDWSRLLRRGLVVVLLTLAGYLVAVAGYGTYAYAREGRSMMLGFHRFNDVATIWFERNILLQNTIWPRDSHLEVIEPASEELRIGRDAAAPSLRVRAYRYVVADHKAREGWRALTLSDLINRSDLLKGEVPEAPLDWKPRDERPGGITVDEIDLKLGRIGIRTERADHQPLPATWNIADNKAAGGYRPLLWADLAKLPLGDVSVPRLSSTWDKRAWPMVSFVAMLGSSAGQGPLLSSTALGAGPLGLTVDEVAADLKIMESLLPVGEAPAGGRPGAANETMAAVRAVLNRLDRITNLQTMMDRLNERIVDPSLSRTMRKLKVPGTATLVYGTWASNIRKTLQKSIENEATGNEFTGVFTDLKPGTYHYRVYGEDYATTPRDLIVLPPPQLISLMAEQNRPAYLYYRPAPGTTGKELRGKKQPFEEIDISNLGSDVSRLEVPAGTDVRLSARANKELREGGVEIKPVKDGDKIRFTNLKAQGDHFEASFENVRQETNFVFVFYDKDGVVGTRTVQLKAKDDQAPELNEVMPDVVRKTKDGYIVSTQARIPFIGRIKDDNGLSGVNFAYTLARLESGPRINVQALLMYAAVPGLVGGRASPALAAGFYTTAQQEGLRPTDADPAAQTVVRLPNLPAYEQALKDRPNEMLPEQTVKELLEKKQKLPYRTLLNDLELKADPWDRAETDPLKCDFPLWPLKLKTLSQRDIQPRYRMQLWVEARDTDLDSEADKDGTPRPHVSPSKEKFSFLIVSENELLSEIAKEEEELRIKFEESYNLILEGEAKLVRETLDLVSAAIKAENLGPMAGRVDTVDQVLEKQQLKITEVAADYTRILKELRTNQVSPQIIDRVSKSIVFPLNDIADFEFKATREALGAFKKALEEGRSQNAAGLPDSLKAAQAAGAEARQKIGHLKNELAKVLENMRRLTGINELIKILRQVEEQEQVQYEQIKKIKDQLEDQLLNGALKGLEQPKKP